jgi:hypothetical protein
MNRSALMICPIRARAAGTRLTVVVLGAAFGSGPLRRPRTSLRSSAAFTKRANRGCGATGRLLNSGWNWQPTKYG